MARTDGPHVDFPCHGARKPSGALRDEGLEWRSRRVAAGPMGRMACATPAPAPRPRDLAAVQGREVPLPARGQAGDPPQPGVVHRHHLHPPGTLPRLPGRRHRLVQPLHRGLAPARRHEGEELGQVHGGRLPRPRHPPIANSDQGATYSSDEYVALLERFGVTQSMDGRGRWRDNVVMGRFWRTLKQECVYISEYSTYAELGEPIAAFIDRYNDERLHQSLGYETPAQWHFSGINELPRAA